MSVMPPGLNFDVIRAKALAEKKAGEYRPLGRVNPAQLANRFALKYCEARIIPRHGDKGVVVVSIRRVNDKMSVHPRAGFTRNLQESNGFPVTGLRPTHYTDLPFEIVPQGRLATWEDAIRLAERWVHEVVDRYPTHG